MIRTLRLNVTTTGSAGSATGSDTSDRPFFGAVRAIYVDWHASAPGATSDITVVADNDDSQPEITLYSATDSATDVWVYPVVQSTDTGGSAVAAQYQHIVIASTITATVSQSDALTNAAVVYVWIDEDY